MIEASPKKNIFLLWLRWHFVEAPESIVRVLRNFLVFSARFFSVKILLKTFFSHWRRYRESYGRGFDLRRYFFTFIGNAISRVVGMIIRLFTLAVWLASEVIIFAIGFIVVAGWIILPAIIVFLIVSAVDLL